jgi:hypothetical protein
MFLVLFGALVFGLHNGTRNFDICEKENFKHQACFEAEQMKKAGDFLKKL